MVQVPACVWASLSILCSWRVIPNFVIVTGAKWLFSLDIEGHRDEAARFGLVVFLGMA